MRPLDIRPLHDSKGIQKIKISFRKNWVHYLQEALGLAIFMISACFFDAMLEAKNASWHLAIHNPSIRIGIMGIAMGLTALFIFYSPLTAPSGAHINPAVTLAFLRIGKMDRSDSCFYIISQFLGGLLAVYLMAGLMGNSLTEPPVNYVVTIPGKYGVIPAAIAEFVIAFVMMMMVLFTSANKKGSRYTRGISAFLVCIYVIIVGPISGFGMNPARTIASAVPAHEYTAIWLYILMPLAGMLLAAEIFLIVNKQK
ncbi:MAG: aquaporin [Bacteroidetes bacterium]|nr:aquaporin [Bacteroidota bacterium]